MSSLFAVELENNNLIDTSDGFSYVICAGGTVEVTAGAALTGSYGVAITPEVGYRIACIRDPGPRKSRIRQAFQFDPNGLVLASGQYISIAQNYCAEEAVYRIIYINSGGTYYVFGSTYNDSLTAAYTSYIACSDAAHLIEFDFSRSSGANDGFLHLWLDGVAASPNQINNVDNDTKYVGYPALGVCGLAPAGTSGTYFADHWRANDDGSLIGA